MVRGGKNEGSMGGRLGRKGSYGPIASLGDHRTFYVENGRAETPRMRAPITQCVVAPRATRAEKKYDREGFVDNEKETAGWGVPTRFGTEAKADNPVR